ncbi:hypothetical protein V2J09_019523 [Rumex salicifolius]
MNMTTELAKLKKISAYDDDVVSDSMFEARQQSSPPSTTVTSSPKRRRLVQKRVVKVPIKEIDESHFNKQGEYCTNPPSDSWAWRKYGQKPIKGSPFPRGYYRCSSSKGCPARKQVERSQSDPTMLLINYSYDHNHSFPVNSRTQAKNPIAAASQSGVSVPIIEEPQLQCSAADQNGYCQEKFADLAGGDVESMISTDEFAWALSDLDTSSNSAILEGSVFSRSSSGVSADFAGYFPMREEDESLFADLGELPEFSVVFGTTPALEEEERRRGYNFTAAAPWCRTTG